MDISVEYLKDHILELPSLVINSALAIYVYGSVARCDADRFSDCDLLVCIEDCSTDKYNELKFSVAEWQNRRHYEFAFYQLTTLREMQKKGSYFLWHIKTEAILLFQRDTTIQELLDSLPRYKGTEDDFLEYSEILKDVKCSLLQDLSTIEYDLSVLSVLARNICIGCCYLAGNMDFGRITPIKKCLDMWKEQFPFSVTEYEELYAYRLLMTRSIDDAHMDATAEFEQKWIVRIEKLLKLAFSLLR